MPKIFRRVRSYIVGGACLVLAATTLAVVSASTPAQAHGNVNDPISRNYRCLKVWGHKFQDPAMATQDPMCWQAWQADPNAMWNWNGLLRDNDGGRSRELIKDGTICGGGGVDNGRYNALDTPGNWVTTTKPAQFRLNLVDQASHGADYIDVYISKDGYDPLTERLGWGDLALVGRTEYSRGGGTVDPQVSGMAYAVDVNASGYDGRRVLMTMWKASHSDQTYFLCSDVIIGAGGGEPAPAPTTPATTSPAPTTVPTTTVPTTTVPTTTVPTKTVSTTMPTTTVPTTATSATTTSVPTTTDMATGSQGCTATYRLHTAWPGGLLGQVVITAGAAPINNWHVMWTTPEGQTITQVWTAEASGEGSMAMFDSMSYNGRLGAGQRASFGFIAAWQGSTTGPTSISCIAG